MPPLIHLIRHGQGYNNLPTTPPSTIDPLLTPLGESQCRALAQTFPHHASIGAIFASPLRRTLQTALLGFESETRTGIRIIAVPEAQEISDLGADTRSDLSVLRQEMAGKPVDLGLVGEGWNSKTGKWAGTVEAVDARAEEVRRFLWGRGEGELVLVSHLGFLHYLTGDWEGEVGEYTHPYSHKPPRNSKYQKINVTWMLTVRAGSSWLNTEFRTYEFIEQDGGKLALRETDASRTRRGATGPRLSEKEQMQRRERKLWIWERIEEQLRAEARKAKPSQLPGPAGTGGSRTAV